MGELTDGEPLFPGESEVDQLYCIQKVLGRMTQDQQEKFSTNPRFIGYKFPDVTKPETIERKYVGKLSKVALTLMEGLLKMDPRERITSKEALCHQWFDGIRSEQEEIMCAEYRSTNSVLRRQESSSNGVKPESSRSRSGIRNNVGGIKPGAVTNFGQQQRRITGMQN